MTSATTGLPRALATTPDDVRMRRVEWALRIGAAGCFIGHGAFGVITKAGWLPYFALFGIPPETAYRLMPLVGTVDIIAGISVLLSPRPLALLYMSVWALWTASLRPLVGESAFEMVERAGNYGVPFALLMLTGIPRNMKGLFARRPVDATRWPAESIGRVLLWTTGLLLFAHGALAAITGKAVFGVHYASVGLPAGIAPIVGWLEMATAVAVVIAPTPALLIAIAVWKISTETLYPISGTPIWEFIERAGSYAAPLTLVLLSGTRLFTRITFPRSTK